MEETKVNYVEPITVQDSGDCNFYHTVTLRNGETFQGPWDLRPNIDSYLGLESFSGMSVLDVGTASGMLTFEIEKRGGQVTSFDLDEDGCWDYLPYAGLDKGQATRHCHKELAPLKRSYWYSHAKNESNARVVYGDIYDLSSCCPRVDCVLFGAVLLHLRNPMTSLIEGAKLASSSVIVADVIPRRHAWLSWCPMLFRNTMTLEADTKQPEDLYSVRWWNISPKLIISMLEILGFPHSTLSFHWQKYMGGKRLLYTVVASREPLSG